MSVLGDLIRPFWLPGLNVISGKVSISLRNWIENKNFQIYQNLNKKSFVLSVPETSSIISAFAFDHNRLSIAAFETIFNIEKNDAFPKSFSWLLIKSYYAAYYSAHAILRILGTSLTYLGGKEASTINSIGKLFGYSIENLESGYYKCVLDSNNKQLYGSKLEPSSGGSHELLWKVFHQTITDLSNNILLGFGLTVDKQTVSNKLTEICDNLAYGRCGNNKNWLSNIRNEITYRHEYGVWFPYKNQLKYYERLYELALLWKQDPIDIKFYKQHGKELQRFIETCCSIVSILRILDIDMARRCPKGRSFLDFGPIFIMNKANHENLK